MSCVRFILILLLISQVLRVTKAQDSLNVRLLGEIHDFVEQAYDVAILGTYAYISSGLNSGLRVLDLSDPVTPVEVGYAINCDPCPGVQSWMSDRIKVSGNRAYVLYFDGTWAFSHYRLYVYDVSNPCRPRQMGYVSLPDNCTSLFVEGDYVYITSFEDMGISEVKIIDVSDPTQPVEVGSFNTPGMSHDIFVTDNTAYIADNSALVIFDVTNPNSLVKLGSYAPEGEMVLIHYVAVQGDYVYVIDSAFGVRILDASNASQIVEVSSVSHNQTDVLFSSIKISGDQIYYVQDGDISGKKLVILDVSNPEAPVEIGSHIMQGFWWVYGFDYYDGYACIAGGKEGLRVVEISAQDSITDVSIYDPYDLTSGLAVSGNHAFIGTYMKDLVVYDVSNPSSPMEATALEFPNSPIKYISVWGDHLYVPGVIIDNPNAGVIVLDISDPANPQEIAYWQAPPGYSGAPFNVERYGNYAFIACAFGGIEIFDVTQIDQPIALDNWTLWNAMTNQGFGVTNVKIAWPYLFAPDCAFGLYVLNVSDPSNIFEVASCETPGEAMWADLSADHQHIYIADADKGLRIIDVSNPLAPEEIGFYEQNLEFANHVAVCGDSVYVSDGGHIGLHVFDVSDPTAPVEVAYHKTQGAFAHDVVVTDGFVYFLDFTHFEIFEIAEGPTAVKDSQSNSLKTDYRIHSVYPNPFNATTKIVFDLAKTGHVTLQIFNITGQKVQTLVDDYYQKGRHNKIFKADKLSSGIYILHLDANGANDSRKLILMK
ncbi:T9SS type A sorting domain-containing protein [Bacteroidota bacterium]